MTIDINTLLIISGITCLLLFAALFIQWKLDQTYEGMGWWALAALVTALAYGAAYLRSIPALLSVGVIGSTVLFVYGAAFCYLGIMRFFGQRERSRLLLAFLLVYTLLDVYLSLINDNLIIRRSLTCLACAVLFFLDARALWRHKTRSVNITANILAGTLLLFSALVVVSTYFTMTSKANPGLLVASVPQVITLSGGLIFLILSTFGYILMVNQRSNVENRQAKENLEMIFYTIPDVVIMTRQSDGAIERINDSFTALTGYTREDVLGKTIFQINLWKEPEQHQKMLATLSEQGICGPLEAVFQTKDGRLLTGMVFARIIHLLEIPYIISVTHDITHRKLAEEQMRETEEKYRSLLDSQEGSIMIFDYDGVHQYANRRSVDSMTKTGAVQDIIGKRLQDIYPPVTAEWQLEQIRRVFSSAEGFSGDFENFLDNQTSWWHLNLQPIRDRAGKVAQVMVTSQEITGRKLAEQAVRESEERFHSLADTAPVLIWMSGVDAQCSFFNKPWLDFTGRTLEQELGNGWMDGIHPDDLQRCNDTYLQAFHARQPFRMEYRLRRASGEYRWVLDHGVPRFLADGNFIGYIGTCLDISEHKWMEEELRESEKRTASIFRFSPIVIGVSTVADGCYTDVNDAFERVLGYSQQETIGRTSHELNIWVGEDTRAKVLREIQANGRVENLEVYLRRKSGEEFPALIFIVPITLHDRACLLTMMMDITERKQVEEQLRETRDALQTIIYSSPLAILALDIEDIVTMWNPAAEAMFGWSDKQILGQANPTVPESKANEYNALKQAALNGMGFSNVETVRQNKDGEQIPVSLSVAPLRGQQGQVIGRMHIITDNTERKKYQEDLRRQATTDELTRVSNRRHFLELANSEIKRAARLKRTPAVALIDIDHFKQINDTYGHATGDQALIEFTKVCQKQIREIDVFARFGGDEFVLLLPETSQEQAYDVLERVRLTLLAQPLILDGKAVALTISSGITSFSGGKENIDTLLSEADQALYRAKEAGRNRVVRYNQLETLDHPA